MIVVSNASPLIVLYNTNELKVLNFLFHKVIIPKAVKLECKFNLPDWIEVKEVKNNRLVKFLMERLHKGEAETIALALELNADLLILDDKKARRIAKSLGLNVVGTLGILILAKRKGYYKEVKPVIDKLLKHGFWIKKEIVNRILKNEKELG